MSKPENEQKYIDALQGKQIPILTLDEKWKALFPPEEELPDELKESVDALNAALEKQNTLREKTKEIKRLKKELLGKIIPLRQKLMDGGDDSPVAALLDKHTELISECNEKIDALEEQQLGLPQEIYDCNFRVMLDTMFFCYDYMMSNTAEIRAANDWIKEARIELKKQVIRRQENEADNYNIYTYMHQIFGPEVIDLFDMQYDPAVWHPRGETT